MPGDDLKQLAAAGIRGELVFATPLVLEAQPRLLGYYRLLLGYSQKEHYHKAGLGRFKGLEEAGRLTPALRTELPALCAALIERACEMLRGIGFAKVTSRLLEELTRLTVGPQLRGSLKNTIGRRAVTAVFELIRHHVGHALITESARRLELNNAAGRRTVIQFASDPDIQVTERISAAVERNLVAIEIKGGQDASNAWNRLGEAEKSHQSARQRGFLEFWTIVNVDPLDPATAREKSPTTTRFFQLRRILSPDTTEHDDFHDRLVSIVGIKAGG